MKASVFLIYFKILDVFGNASLISAHRGRCFSDFKVNFPPNFCDFVSYSIIESYIITSYDKNAFISKPLQETTKWHSFTKW